MVLSSSSSPERKRNCGTVDDTGLFLRQGSSLLVSFRSSLRVSLKVSGISLAIVRKTSLLVCRLSVRESQRVLRKSKRA